jgi:hypothetical protein
LEKKRAFMTVIIALLAIAAIFVQGCSSSTDSKADNENFTVSYTDPLDGEAAPLDVVVYVIFNQTLDSESVTSKNFYVTDSQGTKIPGVLKIVNQSKGIQFTSDSLYVAGQTYTVFATTGVQNDEGDNLNEPFSMQFTCQD